jgi:hypothetical protein
MTDRFAVLQSAAATEVQPPLFVSQAGDASRLVISQLDGGRDAKYLLVSPQRVAGIERSEPPATLAAPTPLKETLGYRPEVAGTDIIYDLLAETMQGKARPFACELAKGETKVYALMPVQLEAIDAHIAATDKGRILRVEFHDARGERLQAVLPLHLRLEGSDGKPLKQDYVVTDRDGRYASLPQLLADAPAGSRVVVRSQLTGWEVSLKTAP